VEQARLDIRSAVSERSDGSTIPHEEDRHMHGRFAIATVAALAATAVLVGFTRGQSAGTELAALAANASFTTTFKAPLGIEGLTADAQGNLYVIGRGATGCPVWRLSGTSGPETVIGTVPPPCSPSGLTFDRSGRLYVADTDRIWVLAPSAAAPPTATVFATGVPGTNGIAFDRQGNLWTGDGTTGQGRVWKIATSGQVTEMFRVQPLANDVALDATRTGGVGRDVRTLPPGTVTLTDTSRNSANTLGAQPLVANGVAFDAKGNLYVADTARGAIWKVTFDGSGNVTSRRNCDFTFPADTLCLDAVWVEHPYLEGNDGIALDRDGNVVVAANERNAIVVVSAKGKVTELFRNAADPVTKLRNTGPLETPTSPFLVGRKLCVAQSDGNRRDNVPNTAGEAAPGTAVVGKVSCLDQQLKVAGLPLPVK
jgi:sugar lactone lactonase YvrE